MTDMPNRHWIIAGLGAAAIVIFFFAMAVAISVPTAAGSMGVFDGERGDGPAGQMVAAGMRTFALAALVASIVGVPVALLFTGVMALLERGSPGARTLGAWLGGGAVAGVPVVFCTFFILGGLNPLSLLADLIGVAGAGLAWLFRHGQLT